MPRMISKSAISNSTLSTKVTIKETGDRAILYTHLVITGSQTWVETEKGFERYSRLTRKITAIRRVTKVRVAPQCNDV